MSKFPYKLVYIEWLDAMSNLSTWIDEQDAVEWSESSEGLVKQVGWLIKEDKNCVLLADRLGQINTGSPDLGGVFKIPSKWVKKKVVISSSQISSQ